jgi:hypothetical protein
MEVNDHISYGATTFPPDKELFVPIEYEAGLATEPVWMFVEVKKIFCTYRGIWPDSLAHNLVTIPHIHISTVLKNFFGC